MTVLLRTSRDLPRTPHRWVALGTKEPPLDAAHRVETGQLLEGAFDRAAREWLDFARRHLGSDSSAALAHTPSCAANASDFGVMLAWTKLIDGWAAESKDILAVCDDPWLFRHLATRPGVRAGKPPARVSVELKLAMRGFAARTRAALRLALHALTCRGQRNLQPGGAWLLVYAHPKSAGDGFDAYFGELPKKLSGIRRAIHVDGTPARAAGLGVSLHGFGNLRTIASLPFARWTPSPAARTGTLAWLVRRAQALEGGTGQGAMIAWQLHCQKNWLKIAKPRAVAWPWENHGWERDLVRACRAAGVSTLGYQHSVIGGRMLNYAPLSNPDGKESLPNRVFCSGAATHDQLLAWEMPRDRLAIGGALRFNETRSPRFDPLAPVFLALPFDGQVAGQMVAAARAVPKRSFLVKDHPMTPFAFTEEGNLKRTDGPLSEQAAVSAVVFAATTVGLEALIARLPTIRFRPRGCIALDILPKDMVCPAAEADALAAALDAAQPGAVLTRERVFGTVDWELWREALG